MKNSVKKLLEISDTSQDEVIDEQIAIVTQSVLNKCNISALPQELESVVVDVVVKKMNIEPGVKSINDGSVSISYVQDEELKPYEKELSRFRKLVW